MNYNKETNTYTLYSLSDFLSNFPHKAIRLKETKHTITDKNNKEAIIYYAIQELEFPIKIKIWVD